MSDRLGDSQEQSKIPEDDKFCVFSKIFENSEKNMRPRSAPRAPQSDQEEPKSTPRALRGAPGMAQESPRRLPEAFRRPFVSPKVDNEAMDMEV